VLPHLLRFALIGGVGSAAHFGVLALLTEGAGISAVWASQAGAVVGAVVNYALNRRWNYRTTVAHRITAPRFAVVVLAGWLLNGALMALLAGALLWHWLPAQALTTLLVLLWNFGINHLWTFHDVQVKEVS
jgi:putative flippase GtrA